MVLMLEKLTNKALTHEKEWNPYVKHLSIQVEFSDESKFNFVYFSPPILKSIEKALQSVDEKKCKSILERWN